MALVRNLTERVTSMMAVAFATGSLLNGACANALDTGHIADAIWRIEGGHATKWPYGIKCHHHSPSVARRMCIRTVANCHADWLARGKPDDFLTFLADRYCPPSIDPQGNKNWKRNIRKALNVQQSRKTTPSH